MIIIWLDEAIDDLRSLRMYIAQENPISANLVAKRILNSVNLLSQQPSMGRAGRAHITRELIIAGTPYIVPYRVKNNVIEILRVIHSSMQWPEKI